MTFVPIWDDVLTDADRAGFAKGYSATDRVGFGERPAVLVVDMCRAFVEDEYPTGDSRHGRPAVAATARLLAAARAAGSVPILFTTYSPIEFIHGWAHWKGATLHDPSLRTERAFEIVPELAPGPGERVLTKAMPSAFFGTPLASLLTYQRVDTVIVAGMVTSGCVRASAVDAFSHNFRVIVPEECVADRGELSHKVNLFDIHMKYGDVCSLAEVIGHLEALPRAPALAAAGR